MQNVKATDILLNDTLFCSSHFQYLISKQDLTFVSRIKNEYANCKTSKKMQVSKYLALKKSSVAMTHCSKSSFFVQKLNFDFPRKLSIFSGEKLMKMLWFRTF